MADFKIAFAITNKIEAGYANDKNDRGGETYAGIARKSNPMWPGWRIVDGLKNAPGFPESIGKDSRIPPLVQSFYQTNYWDSNHLSEVTDQHLANELYDIGVNMGTGEAVMFLQRALNIAGRMGKTWPVITVDGGIGTTTLNTLKNAKSWEILKLVGALQGAKYIDICERDPSQLDFIASWMSRFGQEFNQPSNN